jgi:hypothetical protein
MDFIEELFEQERKDKIRKKKKKSIIAPPKPIISIEE